MTKTQTPKATFTSKRELTEKAQRALRHGYFAVGHADAKIRCPRCEQHDLLIYGSMGRRPRLGEMIKQVVAGMHDCEIDASVEP